MPKLVVFNHVSLDGYFVDSKGDMSWAHVDPQDAAEEVLIVQAGILVAVFFSLVAEGDVQVAVRSEVQVPRIVPGMPIELADEGFLRVGGSESRVVRIHVESGKTVEDPIRAGLPPRIEDEELAVGRVARMKGQAA